jgi:8-oxo-dGTP pyrophosphatase MutT (NUDIX family)
MRKETSAGAVVFYQDPKTKTREYLLLNYINKHWDFPKGHIELHETPIETVIREIKEETNLKIKIIKGFEKKVSYNFKDKGEFVYKEVIFYLARANSKKVILSEEHRGYVWLPYYDALKLITFNKNILKAAEIFLKNLGKINKA